MGQGGVHTEKDCIARQKVALIVPYRDREQHLRILLRNLHPFLQVQHLEYGVFVIEQYGNGTFNKGMIMNIAFAEISKDPRWDCFIFHDVDLLPENRHLPYSCTDNPIHLSVAVNTLMYKLPYPCLFGGAVAISRKNFARTNGYSNCFFLAGEWKMTTCVEG